MLYFISGKHTTSPKTVGTIEAVRWPVQLPQIVFAANQIAL